LISGVSPISHCRFRDAVPLMALSSLTLPFRRGSLHLSADLNFFLRLYPFAPYLCPSSKNHLPLNLFFGSFLLWFAPPGRTFPGMFFPTAFFSSHQETVPFCSLEDILAPFSSPILVLLCSSVLKRFSVPTQFPRPLLAVPTPIRFPDGPRILPTNRPLTRPFPILVRVGLVSQVPVLVDRRPVQVSLPSCFSPPSEFSN